MSDTKLVITGASQISAIGVGFDALAANLGGAPQLSSVKSFEFHELTSETPCFRLHGFDPELILGKKGLRTKDLATKLILAAMELGFKTRFDGETIDTKPGIAIGTAFGSVQSIGDFLSDSIVNGVNAVNPMAFANTVINAPTGNANIRYEVKTLSTTISTGFNAGLDAIIYSCDYIRRGYLSALVTGGLEEISYYELLGLGRSGLLSRSGCARPFAKDADGVVMGEGCALFMVETAASAQAHNAVVLAEIAGYCNCFDPGNGSIGFNPDAEGAVYAITKSLEMAGIRPEQIGFIASSANGIAAGDAMEALAIKKIFGNTPVAAYKTKTGECYGASAALCLGCGLSDMKNNRISGTGLSYPAYHDISVVSETISNYACEYMLVTSFSCEGHCSVLILKNVH